MVAVAVAMVAVVAVAMGVARTSERRVEGFSGMRCH